MRRRPDPLRRLLGSMPADTNDPTIPTSTRNLATIASDIRHRMAWAKLKLRIFTGVGIICAIGAAMNPGTAIFGSAVTWLALALVQRREVQRQRARIEAIEIPAARSLT